MPCSPRMRKCSSSCLHLQSVEDYRAARAQWEEARESELHMQMEDDDYAAKYPPPTFKAWLQGRRRA